MFKIYKYVLLVGFLFFSTVNLFPEVSIWLEPENNINILNNGIRSEESGVLGLRLESCNDGKAILIELESPFKVYNGFLLVSEKQVFNQFNLQADAEEKLIEKIKNGSYEYLSENIGQLFFNARFVKAKDLIVGDKIRGSQYNELEVTKIEYVKLNKRINFYELSLDEHHTFYVIDSAGHYILTHNICFWTAVGIGALIGGISGAYYVAWKSHKKGVFSVSIKVLLRSQFRYYYHLNCDF